MKQKIHTISILVNNQPGALVRVAQVFTRRSFNITSINVSPTRDDRFSHMTITASGAAETVTQIILQLEKLVDVLHAIEHTEAETTRRELALLKVSGTSIDLSGQNLTDVQAAIIEQRADHAMIQLTGMPESIDTAVKKLETSFEIIEQLRTGALAMTHADHQET